MCLGTAPVNFRPHARSGERNDPRENLSDDIRNHRLCRHCAGHAAACWRNHSAFEPFRTQGLGRRQKPDRPTPRTCAAERLGPWPAIRSNRFTAFTRAGFDSSATKGRTVPFPVFFAAQAPLYLSGRNAATSPAPFYRRTVIRYWAVIAAALLLVATTESVAKAPRPKCILVDGLLICGPPKLASILPKTIARNDPAKARPSTNAPPDFAAPASGNTRGKPARPNL